MTHSERAGGLAATLARTAVTAAEPLRASPQFFRLWSSTLLATSGRWGLTLVLTWMAFNLTGSHLAVGLTGAAAVAPLICGLPGGFLADRMCRTRLIAAGQLLGLATGIATAALSAAGALGVEHIIIAAFAIGLSSEGSRPARMALMADLVGDRLIAKANGLNVVGTHGSRMAAPTLAAILIGWRGPEAALLMATAWYVPAMFALRGIAGTGQRPATEADSAWQQFRGGALHVLHHPALRGLLTVTAAGNLLLWPIGAGFCPSSRTRSS